MEKALGPGIASREGMSPVPFHITSPLGKIQNLSVEPDFPRHRMLHAVHHVPAFQKGNVLERPHDVIGERRDLSKEQVPADLTVLCPDVQVNPRRFK